MAGEKVVVFSGAGVSAESGLSTFRDFDGLWNRYRPEELATPEAWEAHPEVVLAFYNERRRKAAEARPNPAHLAIASLQEKFDVVVITQNVDDLHERAGSEKVLHLHGRLNEARSTVDPDYVVPIGERPISMGQTCPKGTQLRPNVVWFGESIHNLDVSIQHFHDADRVLVVGTSLSVFPAAGLIEYAHRAHEKVVISKDLDYPPPEFRYLQGTAGQSVPQLCKKWCA